MSLFMHLTLKRLVGSGCRSRAGLIERLAFWADRYGFRPAAAAGSDFVYTRGSHWQALYTFDLRKVPTEVRVRFVDDEAGDCLCTMTCGTWLQFSAPGDEQRLAEQMDLLEACLKGALAEQGSAAEPGAKPGPGRNQVSPGIQESTYHGR